MPDALKNAAATSAYAHAALDRWYRAAVVTLARTICEQRLARDPDNAACLHTRGLLAIRDNDLDVGLACLRRAVDAEPSNATYLSDLAETLGRLGSHHEAEHTYRRALAIAPDRADLDRHLGDVLQRQSQTAEAGHLDALRRLTGALELLGRRLDAAGVWFTLGRALERRERLEDAAAAYREALARNPNHLKALVTLGSMYLHLNQPGEAIVCLERAIAIRPDHVGAHHALRQACALVGDLERHWCETAWCNRCGLWGRRYFEQPEWDGRSLTGRTLLLWTNESPGDTILLIRFAARLKICGARVLVEAHRELVPLVARMDCVDQAVAAGTPLPAFDVQASLPSLPPMFQTSLQATLVAVPYLRVDAHLASAWRARLGSTRDGIIGVAWGGDTAPKGGKRPAAAAFDRLQRETRARTINLDADPWTGPSLDSTAALLSNLDLIITADVTIAHLAGALGLRVWTLLPFVPDCRWGREGNTSPWYPTMRLFRQQCRGDWTSVLDEVHAALTTGVG